MPYGSGDAMKCIVSAGVVYPDDVESAQPQSMVDKLQGIFRREPKTPPVKVTDGDAETDATESKESDSRE